MNSSLKNWLKSTSFIFFIWWLISISIETDILFPNPIDVIVSILSYPINYILSGLVTSIEAILGLILAIFLSLFMIILITYYKPIKNYVLPILIMIKSSPAVVYVPLFIIFVGIGIWSKVLVSAMISFFPLVMGGIDGIANTPNRYTYFASMYGAKNLNSLRFINWGFCISGILTGLKTSAPLSVVGAVVGEYVAGGSPTGIGSLIFSHYGQTEMVPVFGGALIATIIGLLFFYIAHKLSEEIHERLHLRK